VHGFPDFQDLFCVSRLGEFAMCPLFRIQTQGGARIVGYCIGGLEEFRQGYGKATRRGEMKREANARAALLSALKYNPNSNPPAFDSERVEIMRHCWKDLGIAATSVTMFIYEQDKYGLRYDDVAAHIKKMWHALHERPQGPKRSTGGDRRIPSQYR